MVGSPPGVNWQLDQFTAQMLPCSMKKLRPVYQILNTMDIALILSFYCIFNFIFGGVVINWSGGWIPWWRHGCGWCTDLLIIAIRDSSHFPFLQAFSRHPKNGSNPWHENTPTVPRFPSLWKTLSDLRGWRHSLGVPDSSTKLFSVNPRRTTTAFSMSTKTCPTIEARIQKTI